ncbi:arginase family protein [Thermomonospora umbrina]|uniref:Arginase n=1 Tax=Thermomonospora umbrina TaxID=111806 RepID=A0A3D9SR58_9ACTN|nr:arginase [Thermomonospora umbrina]
MTALEIPQWQGSASPGARLLADGAARLAAFVRADHRVPVLGHAGEESAGVRAFDVLSANLAAARASLGGSQTIVVGGDCGVELAPVERAAEIHGERLTVVWFDAHGDLNSPESSPSHAFHGMVLRALLGEGPPGLLPRRPIRPEQVVLAGVRALDPGEREFVEAHGIRHVPAGELDALAESVHGSSVYVHIDLDVLDPTVFGSVGFPEPGGVTPEALLTAVRDLSAGRTVAGLGITEYQPGDPHDEETLASLVPALVDAVR